MARPTRHGALGSRGSVAVPGVGRREARKFATVANVLERRIELFVSLPIARLDRFKLQQRVGEIGES